MTSMPKRSAVVAGLMGASAMGAPVQAYGLALADGTKVGLLTGDFLLGLIAGAASCGAVTLAVNLASNRAKERKAEQDILDNTTVTLRKDDLAAAQAQSRPVQREVAASQAAEQHAAQQAAESHIAPQAEPQVAAPRARRAMVLPEIDPVKPAAAPVKQASAPAKAASSVSTDATHAPAAQTKRAARHEATDLADIATNYVERQTKATRAKSRARGVKALLAERMSRGMFDDLPVIQRADGTVGDVGTDWWNFKMGNSVKNDFSDLNTAADEGLDIDMTGEHNKLQSYKSDNAQLEGAARIAYISRGIAEVDEGVFPERRDPKELDSEDLWDQAMKSMEKRGRELPQPFERITADSAEDKREQEAPTQVIPFRVPAGHPEIVDTATYVDYLIGQEFDKNTSQAVRQTSRDYLRVIEGGSQSGHPTVINVPKRAPRTTAHTARHMAPTVEEAEDLPIAKEA